MSEKYAIKWSSRFKKDYKRICGNGNPQTRTTSVTHKPYLTDEVSGDAYDAIGRDKRVPPIRGIRLLGRDALVASADRPDGYAIVI